MTNDYQELKSELGSELINILKYWSENTLDYEHGGFLGKRNHYNEVVHKASKGIILNARILWSYSAASNHLKSNAYKLECDRAYHYLESYFRDKIYGGVYWELSFSGKPISVRKQVYAHSFAIYALVEYYLFSKNKDAKTWAIELFELLEKHAKDKVKLGYLEAFSENWDVIADMRLSEKDMNAAKTMNTHLHVLEAYTSLLKIYKNNELKKSLRDLVEIFLKKFLTPNNHYHLFFDEDWNLMSNSISYGHDIETAWLVIEAAKAIEDVELLKNAQNIAIKVANTFLEEAIDNDGSVINEKNLTTNEIDYDRHWWPQVEALIGLKYAYKIEPQKEYIKSSLAIWDYTKKNLIDKKNGEWHFRVNRNGNAYTEEDKVSMWKAPYHAVRACILLNEN
ncbi:mannobiose 2-epimerase [Saonia flava]|uniref:Cellobiose 2-epimerase n=1 Tax=Saonia flava TaxID=523696 RepID=A0A846R609_9FLAO|nr:AGE family epimerase/isomerase [Saonia flava]NJB72814.1 mannobiose 2-epimerase [Saonia flava]